MPCVSCKMENAMQHRMNSNLIAAPRSAIRQFAQLAAATPGCISLTLGEPDFPTPEPVCLRAKAALDQGKTHYIANNGDPALRRDIAEFENRTHGLHYHEDEVIVTVGATEGLYTALAGILEPGDQVLVPTPAFVLYSCIIGLCGAETVPVDTSHSRFQLTDAMLQAAVTERTKAIVLNSPNNPTGCLLNWESLAAVARLARERELFVICDEVYRQLCYALENPQFSTLYPDLKDRVIVVQSFSKPYAMTGWRVGYLLADMPVKSQLEKLHQFDVVSTVSFLQDACRTALQQDPAPMLAVYRRRRDYALARLADMGMNVVKPDGAFYLFPSIESYGMGSAEFCTRMIQEAGVAATPGFCFGSDRHIRLSYCCADSLLEEGLNRMEQFVKQL